MVVSSTRNGGTAAAAERAGSRSRTARDLTHGADYRSCRTAGLRLRERHNGSGAHVARAMIVSVARVHSTCSPCVITLEDVLSKYWGYTSFRPLQREAMDAILGRPRLGRRAADGRRQVALLSGAGAGARRARPGHLAAHLADEGPGRHARGERRRRGLLQQLAGLGSEGVGRRGAARGAVFAPVCRRPSGSPARRATASCTWSAACRTSRSTRRTASASGATTSVPSTAQIGALRSRYPGVSLHAFTATATARVRRDIASQLELRDAGRARRLVRPAEPRLPRPAARRR